MALNSFATAATVIAASFLAGTHLVENDLAQSFFLGAFAMGLTGSVVLLSYAKVASVTGTWPSPRPAPRPFGEPLRVSRGARRARPEPGRTLSLSALRDLVEQPAESSVLNSFAGLALLASVGFLGGTYAVNGDLAQSFLLGAFATGMGGAILMLGYTKVARVKEQRRVDRAVRESEARFRVLIEHATDMVTVLEEDHTISFEAPAVLSSLGYEPDALAGTNFFERVHPEDAEALSRAFEEMIADPSVVVRTRYRIRHADGRWRDIEATGRCIVGVEAAQIVNNARDVTERTDVERALRASEVRFRDFAETAADYFWEMDAELRFTYLSERFEEKTQIPSASVLGKHCLEVFSSRADDPEAWAAHLRGLEAHQCYQDFEIKQLQSDGSVRVFRDSGKPRFDAGGVFVGYRGATRDVTESHLLAEQLTYQASHDVLTGLINRQEFDARLKRAIERARREGSDHVLCYLDLDQFKVVNDTFGHVAGDGMLRQIAALLQDRLRQRDSLARLGGDEFAVLMEHCSVDQGVKIANAIHRAVEDFRFPWERTELKVGVSIGLVPITAEAGGVTEVLSAADSACYIAKERGRNRTHVLREDDSDLARRHGEMRWVGRINQALDADEFRLSYQPVLPLNEEPMLVDRPGQHVELLLRLDDAAGELVFPDAFLPAAERYGLAVRVDQWVVRRIIAWLADHPQQLENLGLLSINLSGHSLADETFPDFVTQQFKETGVPPEKICFEITETAAIADVASATRFINDLRSMRCKFALDDFGSGLSSFAYLKTLPVDFLKIDGFFVKNITTDPIDLAMVRSINEVGHLMGKKTIAEYAESQEIIEVLRAIGVDYAQGFAVCATKSLEEMR